MILKILKLLFVLSKTFDRWCGFQGWNFGSQLIAFLRDALKSVNQSIIHVYRSSPKLSNWFP